MLRPYILKRVSLPQKRLLVNQSALPLSLAGLMLSVIFNYYILGLIYFLVAHSILIYLTHQDPYFIQVWLAKLRYQGATCVPSFYQKNLKPGCNVYEC